jgi:phenylpropionate dioxygenase-like ring-hydroxylating dioxygenase large terminal subunit
MRDDPVVRDSWHVLAHVADVPLATTLLGQTVVLAHAPDGAVTVTAGDRALQVRTDFGYVWSSLGTLAQGVFALPELAEPDRRLMHAASVTVRTSAPRVVENFLDLAHFPYVHTDYLGAEPHTEVQPYEVRITEADELIAEHCRFVQPRSAANADGAFEVEYLYRVPHPYCAVLYKDNPVQRGRRDVIALFVQPMEQERVRAHMLLAMLDDATDDAVLRSFQLEIFGQDKPILENQFPRRLPLRPAAEVSVRADAMSVAYRRWLARRDIRYGTIPA